MQHHRMVRSVLDYIAAGDIYQANISTRFVAPRPEGLTRHALEPGHAVQQEARVFGLADVAAAAREQRAQQRR